jgi:molybdopterin synthase catalytic subunit
MMRVTVRFFATLKDRAGLSEVEMEVAEETLIETLEAQIGQRFPALAPLLPTSLIAINEEFAFPGEVLHDGDVVAFFPPVSGGAAFPEYFDVTPDTLDIDDILRRITIPMTGGICTFTGAVRGLSPRSGAQTARLYYEAYREMAEAKLRQVAAEIRERYPKVQGIALVQRIGTLEIGEVTVLVACAGGHRDDDIFEAARYGIDRLKEIVPVWKQEIRPDGDEKWIEGSYRPNPSDRAEE